MESNREPWVMHVTPMRLCPPRRPLPFDVAIRPHGVSCAYRGLQLVLHVLYGVLIGATFWNTPTRLDDTAAQMASSCIWVIMLQSYIHVFKVSQAQ